MLRGVNRCIIEVKNTGSPFFERVICFVRPEYCSGGFPDLHKTAERYVQMLEEDTKPDLVPEKRKVPSIFKVLIPILTAVVGVVFGMLLK